MGSHIKNISIIIVTSLLFSGCFWNSKTKIPRHRGIKSCQTNQCVDDSDFRYYYNDYDKY